MANSLSTQVNRPILYESRPIQSISSKSSQHKDLIYYSPADSNSLFEFDLFIETHSRHKRHNISYPWGVAPSNFEQKSAISLDEFINFCDIEIANGAHVVFINPYIDMESMFFNVWEQGLYHGAGIKLLFNHCIRKGIFKNYSIMGQNTFCLSNYFIGTPKFWDKYLSFASSAIREISSNKGTTESAFQQGTYSLKPVASLRVFFMERLFSQFIHENPSIISASYPNSEERARMKYGNEFAPLFIELSRIKNLAILKNDAHLLNEWNILRVELNQVLKKKKLI